MTVEIVYLAWNRRAFTEASFTLLRANTDWDIVDRLVVYDDRSQDGTGEWLAEAGAQIGVPEFELRRVHFRSPPATMNDAFACTKSDIVAKLDSDIACPPGWLPTMLGVMERNRWVDALGMEAGRTGPYPEGVVAEDGYGCETSSHIGGVGLIRTDSIRKPMKAHGRYGWTEYQGNLDTAWIKPDLPVVQLDLIPEEPWRTLAADYVGKGWSRYWTPYDPLQPEWWAWVAPQLASLRVKVAA